MHDVDLDRPRADLDEVAHRHLLTRDEGRPAAVAKRHKQNRRTARENIADLVDEGSFVEYGALAVAAQRSRRSEEDLIVNTPADGLVAGWRPSVPNVRCCGRTVVVSYDYTVLAGTQGMRNHAKTDRSSNWPPVSGCRSCFSPKAAEDGPATRISAASQGWMCRRSARSGRSADVCRCSRSCPAAVSPAMRRWPAPVT